MPLFWSESQEEIFRVENERMLVKHNYTDAETVAISNLMLDKDKCNGNP